MICRLSLCLGAILLLVGTAHGGDDAIRPKDVIQLFNGKDLSGLTTWVKGSGLDDPQKVFSVQNGVLRASGTANGYVRTKAAYRDYRVVVEYRWGKRTDGGKYVRNSGILLHGTGPDGGAGGTWMSSIECQLAQGCVGDLIAIRSKEVDVSFKSETELGPDKRPRWHKGGEVRAFPPTKGQLWWSKHEPFFKELLDTRGKDDVDSPLGEWTRVECVCRDRRIQVFVNGTQVNECFDAQPSAGKILLQSEGFAIDFRRFELHPLSD